MASPKIAETIPLSQADEARREEYGELADMDAKLRTEDTEKLDMDGTVDAAPAAFTASPALDPLPPETIPAISDEDKRAFVRAILGDKPFEKSFLLFSAVDAKFRSRTGQETEKLYEQLDADAGQNKIRAGTPELWELWANRYRLASSLIEIRQPGLGAKSYVETNNLFDRVRALLELPQPLFHALLRAGHDFELMIAELSAKAQERDFWPAGGFASPSVRTSPAPLTTAKPAPARIGA